MTESFIGEIKMFAGSFAPQGWMPCDGRILSIAQNQALFAILGTTYGGDGRSTFALPNLNGRVAMHFGQALGQPPHSIGETGGSSSMPLTVDQMPSHTHAARLKGAGNSQGNRDSPAGNVPGMLSGCQAYSQPSGTLGNMAAESAAIGNAGGSAAHENMQPYLAMNFIICVMGIFPPRS